MLLEARDIHKSFKEGRDMLEVLKGISLSLSPGEIVILEGPSGSGKTTLLSILGSILTPSAGQVLIHGQIVNPDRLSRLPAVRRRYIGFVFQQFNLFPALNAVENVEYALNVKGIKGKKARELAEALIDEVDLSRHRDYVPQDLSGGQKQRIAIARALAGDPPILLADEPTANLDSKLGVQILDLFRAIVKKENRALLVVTHDPKVRTYADRVLRIHDGLLVQ